jgi:hypothetical protein
LNFPKAKEVWRSLAKEKTFGEGKQGLAKVLTNRPLAKDFKLLWQRALANERATVIGTEFTTKTTFH